MLTIVPKTAPPWKADTMPPCVVASGSPKYETKFGWAMVEAMMPLS